MNQVEKLADRPIGCHPANVVPYKKLVGLDKIIAEALNIKSRHSKKVQLEYNNLIKQGDNEFNILLNISLEKLITITSKTIAKGIKQAREGNLIIKSGFDGKYGTIKIFKDSEKQNNKQSSLF